MAHYQEFKVVDLFDTPVLSCSSTNIPASSASTLTVVASLIEQCQRITCIDATGKYIGLYSGDSGSEVLVCIIGGGYNFDQDVIIVKGSRVSVRSMENAAITADTICVQFKAIQE